VSEYDASIGDLRRSLRSGEVSIGVYIPADFERRRLDGDRPLAQLLVDGSEPTIENIARAFVAMPLPKRAGVYQASRQVFEVRTEYNPEKRTAVQIVPALIGVILTMTMTMFTAVAIVRERERGNLELLITTPASPLELMLGKLVPYVFIGLIQTTLVLLLGVLLFHVPINGSLWAFYLAALLFIAATLTLGLIASTLAETQMQAFQMSIFVLLPSILLSGFVFPFDGMPPVARWIAQLLPLTHFVELVSSCAGRVWRSCRFRSISCSRSLRSRSRSSRCASTKGSIDAPTPRAAADARAKLVQRWRLVTGRQRLPARHRTCICHGRFEAHRDRSHGE